MGVDTCVFVKESDFKRLIEDDFDRFLFLIEKTKCRWNTFIEKFEDVIDYFALLDEVYTSRDMIRFIALTDKLTNEEKSEWLDVLFEYDLIFQPDTKEKRKEYIDLCVFYLKMIEFVRKNLEAIKNNIKKQK